MTITSSTLSLPTAEPDKTATVNFRLDSKMRQRLHAACQATGVSQSELIRHFLAQGLDAIEQQTTKAS